jgi:hypothetical protein
MTNYVFAPAGKVSEFVAALQEGGSFRALP